MPIIDLDGRPRSIRTPEEETNALLDEIGMLPPDQQQAVLEIAHHGLQREGIGDDYDATVRSNFESPPATIREFLTDPYFLGETGSSLWPVLKDDIVRMFEGNYSEAIFTGALGFGKTFLASTALSYVLYQMSCLRDPQRSYGIDRGSHVYIAMLSVTEKQARRVVVNELIGKVVHSPYFRTHFPGKAAPSLLEIRFPKRIMAIAGSTSSSATIGLSTFAGFIDEAAFLGNAKEIDRSGKIVETDKSEQLYKSIVRRMKSRFQKVGKLPGLMILASSKERPVAFIDRRIDEARSEGDPSVFVIDYPVWGPKPKEAFSGKNFKVAVGSDQLRSRILSERAEDEVDAKNSGLRVVEVPEEYRKDFERDLEGAIRDVAGISTTSVSPYIQRTEKVAEAFDDSLPRPATLSPDGDPVEEWLAGGPPLMVRWGQIANSFERRLPGGHKETGWRPKRHPGAARYAHVDPSLTGDCTGLVIAHVANQAEVIRRDSQGNEYTELAPVIETDLVLRIVPPPGDEILLSDVRSILYQFIDHGFDIRFVSMDSYNSADSLQQFKRRGVTAEVVSVDRTTEPYDVLKTALYETRVKIQRHACLEHELKQLQRVPRRGGAAGFKIDHPKVGIDGKPGSKDCADALAGCVFSLSQRPAEMPMQPVMGRSEGGASEDEDVSWVTDGKRVAATEPSRGGRDPSKDPLPFLR